MTEWVARYVELLKGGAMLQSGWKEGEVVRRKIKHDKGWSEDDKQTRKDGDEIGSAAWQQQVSNTCDDQHSCRSLFVHIPVSEPIVASVKASSPPISCSFSVFRIFPRPSSTSAIASDRVSTGDSCSQGSLSAC